jgi:hypothetical protein
MTSGIRTFPRGSMYVRTMAASKNDATAGALATVTVGPYTIDNATPVKIASTLRRRPGRPSALAPCLGSAGR